MKEINLRTPKAYGQRVKSKSNLVEIRKKYFLVVEGSKTEIQYFNGIFNYRRELNINTLIDIIVLERESRNATDSHPIHILNGIINKLKETGEDKLDYRSEIDEIWLIFDRDPSSLNKVQFEYIDKMCKQYGFHIGLSNPNFEFWLLLHLSGIEKYDKSLLLENKKVGAKRRFIEKELSNRLEGGYNKNNIGFERFKENVYLAIEQEKFFCEDIYDMIYFLGSYIGLLLSSMMNNW